MSIMTEETKEQIETQRSDIFRRAFREACQSVSQAMTQVRQDLYAFRQTMDVVHDEASPALQGLGPAPRIETIPIATPEEDRRKRLKELEQEIQRVMGVEHVQLERHLHHLGVRAVRHTYQMRHGPWHLPPLVSDDDPLPPLDHTDESLTCCAEDFATHHDWYVHVTSAHREILERER